MFSRLFWVYNDIQNEALFATAFGAQCVMLQMKAVKLSQRIRLSVCETPDLHEVV